MTTRTAALVQTAAELYVEAQVYARRQADPRFTPAQRAEAVAELARLCGNTAAQLKRLAAHKQSPLGG